MSTGSNSFRFCNENLPLAECSLNLYKNTGFSISEILDASPAPKHNRTASNVLKPSFLCSQRNNVQRRKRNRSVSSWDHSYFELAKGPDTFDLKNIQEILGGTENRPRILPLYGLLPCTAHCMGCRKDVHTTIDFLSRSRFEKAFLATFASFYNCCSAPIWLNNLRVHVCPMCSAVLGKVNEGS